MWGFTQSEPRGAELLAASACRDSLCFAPTGPRVGRGLGEGRRLSPEPGDVARPWPAAAPCSRAGVLRVGARRTSAAAGSARAPAALLLQEAINGKGGLYLRSGRQLHTAGRRPLAGSAQHLAERGERGGKAQPQPGVRASSLRRLPAPATRPRGGFAASRPLPRGRRGSVPQFPLPEHPAQLQGLRSRALP